MAPDSPPMECKDSSRPRRQLPAIPVSHSHSDQPPAIPAVTETPVPPATFYSTPTPVTARHPPQSVPGAWSTSTNDPPAWGANHPEWEQSADVRHDAWNGEHDQDRGNFTMQRVNIDGRVEEEESNWWDPSVRKTHNRPGSGILPTLLQNYLHDPDHTLFSVSASPPEVKPRYRSPGSHPSTFPPVNPPSADDVRGSIPHPNAYYCRRHNGWILFLWKYSSTDPPLSKSHDGSPLPDINRRRKTSSCVGEDPHSVTQANKTHHFHYYKAAVDASKITTPFKRAEWEHHSRTESRRRQAVLIEHSNLGTPNLTADDSHEPEGGLLDLYVCCQCTLYCAVSDVITGVIPNRVFEAFVKEKLDHPYSEKTPAVSLAMALGTVLM